MRGSCVGNTCVYTVTQSVVGTGVVAATIGARQGSPTSCILFNIYVNDLIALIKNNCGMNQFLTWLHMLMLMDDTYFSQLQDGAWNIN